MPVASPNSCDGSSKRYTVDQRCRGEHEIRRIAIVNAIGVSTLLAASASGRDVSICSPASPAAHSIINLGVLGLAVIALIFIIVEGVLFYTIWRFRQPAGEAPAEPAQVYGSQPIEVAWT